MRIRTIIYIATVILLIVVCVLGIWATGVQRQTSSPDSICGESQIPELSELLNKSGNYSFSYVNALGQRIAAVDNKGNRYFYIYSPTGNLATIIDKRNTTIWVSNCS